MRCPSCSPKMAPKARRCVCGVPWSAHGAHDETTGGRGAGDCNAGEGEGGGGGEERDKRLRGKASEACALEQFVVKQFREKRA